MVTQEEVNKLREEWKEYFRLSWDEADEDGPGSPKSKHRAVRRKLFRAIAELKEQEAN